MDAFKGVKVAVVCEGRSMPLYDDPDEMEEELAPRRHERSLYVEAVTGGTFQVKVSFNRDYSMHGREPNNVVRVDFAFDGKRGYCQHSTFNTIRENVRRDGTSVLNFGHAYRYCLTSRQWIHGKPAFAALTVGEDNHPPQAQPSWTNVGSIGIEVCQCLRTPHSAPVEMTPDDKDGLVSGVSEKAIKGKAIANSISLAGERGGKGPSYSARYDPVQGLSGTPLRYVIHYRSKEALQSLGCIPRSPSPEPDLREENDRLRAQLAELKNEAKPRVKSEATTSDVIRGIKTEIDEDGEGFIEATRGSASTLEVIDLSDD